MTPTKRVLALEDDLRRVRGEREQMMRDEEFDWELDKSRFILDADRAAAEGTPPLRDHGFRLGPLALQFARLTYALLDADTVGEVLEQVVGAAAQVVPDADLASITLRDSDSGFQTPVTTDPVGKSLDQLQQEYGEGPYWDAARDPGPAVSRSPDLAAEAAWPHFGPAAAELGLHTVLSIALPPWSHTSAPGGALNLYSRRHDRFGDGDQHVALLLATHASLALAHARSLETAALMQTNLQRAIDSRDVIGQAKGILMARQNITAAQAFDILRRTSQDLNTKLIDIAHTLVARYQELDE